MPRDCPALCAGVAVLLCVRQAKEVFTLVLEAGSGSERTAAAANLAHIHMLENRCGLGEGCIWGQSGCGFPFGFGAESRPGGKARGSPEGQGGADEARNCGGTGTHN